MKQSMSKQQWLQLLNEQTQSGLTIAAFCRSKDINTKQFYNHRHKARLADTQPSPFVKAQPSPDQPMPTDIRLQYGKTQINLPVNVTPQWLAQLLTSLA